MYTFSAKTVKGKGRGKIIGFPTINIDPVNIKADYGVYLVMVEIKGKEHKALFHFGPKKTFKEGVSAEIHIVNYDLDIFPKNVIIKVIKRIRDVKKFETVEDLKKQIKRDAEKI